MYWTRFLFLSLFSIFSIHGSTVLITGANRGLGLEFARQFHNKGYEVIGTARRPQKAKELAALGVRVEELDVGNDASAKALSERLEGVSIDLLINNAGIMRGRNDSLAELNLDDLSSSFAVNATGPIRVVQALLPQLKAAKGKKLIAVGSQLGSIQNNSGSMYAYRASKTALNQLNKTMSIELGGQGFTCVVLHPGWVRTDMGGDQATYSPEESVKAMISTIESLGTSSNGQFMDLNGRQLPW